MAEKKLMEKVVRKVLHSFPKVNMPDPFVPYPIPYPPLAKSRFEIFVHVRILSSLGRRTPLLAGDGWRTSRTLSRIASAPR